MLSIDKYDSHKDVHDTKKMIFYQENGNKSAEGKLIDEKNNGKWTFYYENGKIESTGKFSNHKRQGKWKKYSDNGEISAILNYKKDLIHGKFKIYTIDNFLAEVSVYKNGVQNGICKRYSSITGKLIRKGKKLDGERNGLWKYYYRSGKIGAIGQFKNNLKTG